RLLSPTFIIVRRYRIPDNFGFLYHLDLYRVSSEKDLLGLGLLEILSDPDSIVFIEWAEKLGGLLPKERIDVRFSVFENGKHHVSLSSSGLTRGSSLK
ncbi:MAG: tRNA (adenosine(37)-N6)-threonylcarbamoyltransferase complex ATPase subunit type 1 TsaE, partial [Patescibacteria group bacterium]